MHAKFKNSVTIVGVAWAGDTDSYASFVSRHGLTFVNVDDTPGAVFAKYSVPYQSAWVFVSRSGVARTVQGALDDATLESTLEELAAT